MRLDLVEIQRQACQDAKQGIKNAPYNAGELAFYISCFYSYRGFLRGIMSQEDAERIIAQAKREYAVNKLFRAVQIKEDTVHKRLAELRIKWNKTKDLDVARQIAEEIQKITL